MVGGVQRQFFDSNARGAPFGPDDGTVAPWVMAASLPFAPEIAVPTARSLAGVKRDGQYRPYGFRCSFNPTCGFWLRGRMSLVGNPCFG